MPYPADKLIRPLNNWGLVFSEVAVGLFVQLIYGIILAVMLKLATTGNYNFDFLCPIILTICVFSICFCSLVHNITVVAVDRLLAASLLLRYQELVTSRRVAITLVSLWLTTASIIILLPKQSYMVTAVVHVAFY